DSPALQLFLGDVLHRLLGIDDEADVKGASEWLVRHLEMRLEQGALEEETFADHRDQRALDLRQRRWRVGIFAGTFPDSNVAREKRLAFAGWRRDGFAIRILQEHLIAGGPSIGIHDQRETVAIVTRDHALAAHLRFDPPRKLLASPGIIRGIVSWCLDAS